jgi:hypothetical protein
MGNAKIPCCFFIQHKIATGAGIQQTFGLFTVD